MAGESRASQLQAACILFFVLSPIFVSTRLFSRIRLRSWSGLGWDDATLLLAWIFNIVILSLLMSASASGLGQRAADLTASSHTQVLKMAFVADVLYHFTINLIKISIGLLYLQSFFKKWFRTACLALLGLLSAYAIAITITTIVQCTPVPSLWDASVAGTCVDRKALWYANAAFAIATDVVLLALPLQPIHASQVPGGQKVALMVVFALGMFTSITSIVRMQNFPDDPDRTYDIDAPFWAIIEMNLALICASLPGCKLLLTHLFPSQFTGPATPEVPRNRSVDEEKAAPAARRVETARSPTSRPSTANKKVGKSPLSKAATWDDREDNKGLADLAPPPKLNPDRTHRRSSMFRDAYVWLNTMV